MFADRTLLILGAGASYEVGLPLGDALKRDISNALLVYSDSPLQLIERGVADGAINEALYATGNDRSELLKACERISAALPLARSIDNYLHSHRKSEFFELCGKLGIVRCILAAEGNSRMALKTDSSGYPFNFGSLSDSWYNRFASLLFESDFDEFQRRLTNLDVITFNYDRCFEHFMYHAIQTYYGVSPEEAADVVKSMSIYHPYGTVGNLPWMGGVAFADFGADMPGSALLSLAGNIKTYTEGVDRESSEIQAIHTAVRRARTVVILGFGYIPLNMQLLKPTDNPEHPDNSKRKTYYGTVKGLSREDMRIVTHDVRALVQTGFIESKLDNNELTCAKLFNEYAFSLGAS
ncbi:hypothetical protein NKH52_20760 [Mesorhizobium sp. M1066]|uniref:hypothetical protein n=1 Tax=unclassified Mesorhizobium TaxID=325217 RepID=UPI00333DDCB5